VAAGDLGRYESSNITCLKELLLNVKELLRRRTKM
jgi:hypothetical protein